MFKQAILSVLIVAIIASSAYASPIFSFVKQFESANKRSPTSSNICCLPNVFSMKGVFNQVSIVANNSTLQPVDGGFNFVVDYNAGKIRQDITYTVDGAVNTYTNWDFKISSSITVSYDLQSGKCHCHKVTDFNQWEAYCIPNTGTVTKAKIGSYDALKIVNTQNGAIGTFWTFREPQMANDKCWILNTLAVSSTASLEQMYYDMVEKVDSNVFTVPASCPSINTCLSQ
ncbi:hypothetical protein NAEGRDRAFT_70876 [Naegleria gruberi]|uniref:Uncharacterized protein n=1 Tax=Naegleria gruberi TaxID=5762 RepID=D2VPI9_NAEGR|nr:uncharacterized protein NAEGRDRAFT_70876 [Naegleria gruberi]EFC41130.1 hypothetical protein NAEGRDRAFT_70876 [Naegleria gruberi]|eukprot:XP_002673874.1 hypothetical protein NAEGRDRAFT_70876 [Naegleria gruberi strain NEG-M]